jgi:hypothetical protein
MESAGQEVGKIETRLRHLGAKLDRLVVKADQAGAEVTAEYREQLGRIKETHAVVRGKLDAYKAVRCEKWDNFRAGVEAAWTDLEKAFRALKS